MRDPHLLGRDRVHWVPNLGQYRPCPGCQAFTAANKWIAGLCRRCFRTGAAYPEEARA